MRRDRDAWAAPPARTAQTQPEDGDAMSLREALARDGYVVTAALVTRFEVHNTVGD
jgi:hypothetical protein